MVFIIIIFINIETVFIFFNFFMMKNVKPTEKLREYTVGTWPPTSRIQQSRRKKFYISF